MRLNKSALALIITLVVTAFTTIALGKNNSGTASATPSRRLPRWRMTA